MKKLLDMALECELGAARVYRDFAGRFAGEKEASGFWSALCREEEEHARLIGEISGLLTSEQRSVEPEFAQWDPVWRLKRFLEDNPSGEVRTLSDACQLTERIENHEVTSVVQLLAKEFMPHEKRVELLHAQLVDHYQKIDRYLGSCGKRREGPTGRPGGSD